MGIASKPCSEIASGRMNSEIRLMPVALEHVFPERFDLVDVAAFAIHRDAGQQETFRERAFKADLFCERAL